MKFVSALAVLALSTGSASAATGTTRPARTATTAKPTPSPGRKLAVAYPTRCKDRAGDAVYAQGDITAGEVTVQGQGLLFTWTVKEAPALLPGDLLNYWAHYQIDEPYSRASLNIFLLGRDNGTLEAKASIYATNGRTIDVSRDITAPVSGPRDVRIFVPQTRLWMFTGDAQNSGTLDGSKLTTGRWTMTVNRTGGLKLGNDDQCGVDDRDSIPR
jgi:hypothetical protein